MLLCCGMASKRRRPWPESTRLAAPGQVQPGQEAELSCAAAACATHMALALPVGCDDHLVRLCQNGVSVYQSAQAVHGVLSAKGFCGGTVQRMGIDVLQGLLQFCSKDIPATSFAAAIDAWDPKERITGWSVPRMELCGSRPPVY